jgi:hypothetical protein
MMILGTPIRFHLGCEPEAAGESFGHRFGHRNVLRNP